MQQAGNQNLAEASSNATRAGRIFRSIRPLFSPIRVKSMLASIGVLWYLAGAAIPDPFMQTLRFGRACTDLQNHIRLKDSQYNTLTMISLPSTSTYSPFRGLFFEWSGGIPRLYRANYNVSWNSEDPRVAFIPAIGSYTLEINSVGIPWRFERLQSEGICPEDVRPIFRGLGRGH